MKHGRLKPGLLDDVTLDVPMPTSHKLGRSESLLVLFVALGYSAYIYLSRDFGNLGFILRLVKNPIAYAWPVLRGGFILQILIAIAAILSWSRPRNLRWISLTSISIAVLTQTVMLVSCISLEFNPKVTAGSSAIVVTALIEALLFACLVFSLTKGHSVNHTVNPSDGSGET